MSTQLPVGPDLRAGRSTVAAVVPTATSSNGRRDDGRYLHAAASLHSAQLSARTHS